MKKLIALVLLLVFGFAKAQLPERPSPEKLYNNLSKEFPDFLSSDEAAQIEEKLETFSNETSNQICVIILDSFEGYEPMDYATRLGNAWGLGKKDANNGVIVIIKPTKTEGGRNITIAVGYGLEGAIPDLATKRIRDENIAPKLKAGNYFEAINEGVDVLAKLAKGEINVKDYARRSDEVPSGLSTFLIIAVFVIIILFKIFRGGGGGGYTYGRRGRSMYWGGGFGGGSWGGGGGSSSGGGGFGGFGGGSFGGGGSSGSW